MTIESQTLSYTAGEDELKGYMAYDDKSGSPRPGVIVVHEWWGLDDYIRTRVRISWPSLGMLHWRSTCTVTVLLRIVRMKPAQ